MDCQGDVTHVIPLEKVTGITVDIVEVRQGVGSEENEEGGMEATEDVLLPVARWVRHPDRGLIRMSAD